jgi:uncharacterized membrane protein YfcA
VNLSIALVGLVVGIFVGISGVGGSSLMTPLLIVFLRVHPVIAIGTDLLYSVPTKIVGTVVHAGEKTIDRHLVGWLVAGGIPGALAGLAIAAAAKRHFAIATLDGMVRHGVGVALFVGAAVLVASVFVRRQIGAAAAKPWTRATSARIAVLGTVVGLAVAITSIGSGSITMPILYMLLPGYALRRLVGSDVAFGAILIPIAAAGHVAMGNVDVPLALNLLVGSIPGVIVGSKLCKYLPERLLRPAVAGVLIFAGSRLI